MRQIEAKHFCDRYPADCFSGGAGRTASYSRKTDERQGWGMSIAPNTPLGATNPACSPDGSGAVIAAVAEPPVPRVPGHPDHGHRQEKALAPEEEPRWRCK